jgi:hypothetical protein
MATVAVNPRQLAHELIDRLTPVQAAALVTLMETMLDPAAAALARIPIEDEEISEEEVQTVAASKDWLKSHKSIPNEEILAEFGMTVDEFEGTGRHQLEPEAQVQ